MQAVGVRDRRKPGWAWQENELFDSFGAVIGNYAQIVYVHLTRNAYGDASIKTTCRELAEACRISKDSVQRALGVMELVGMLKRVESAGVGRGGRVSEYYLADLKELAVSYGATFDPKRCSYVLSPAQIASLVTDVRDYLRGAQRKTFVAQSDKEPAVAVETFVAQSDSFVAPSGGFVSPAGQASSIGQDTRLQDYPSPTPPPTGGGERAEPTSGPKLLRPIPVAGEVAQELEVDREVGRVAAQLNLADERLRPALALAMLAFLAKGGGRDPTSTADAMIAAYREYLELGECLRFTWGPKKFFTQGHWINRAGWPIDRSRSRTEASIGIDGGVSATNVKVPPGVLEEFKQQLIEKRKARS